MGDTAPQDLTIVRRPIDGRLSAAMVDTDPDRAEDDASVQKIYGQVAATRPAGMGRLAARRKLPVLG